MSVRLTPHQRRVLGVLIEKRMTTPNQYPLTLNALLAGCNQLTCRDPVLSLSEADVGRAVYELQQMELVVQAPPDRNARANRFMHTVEQRLGWGTRERAVIAELLLRGPQTVGELKSNASRMTPLEDIHYVAELLGALAGRDPPVVRELPRQPGKSVVRYDHLLYGEGEAPAFPAAPVVAAVSSEARAVPREADPLEQRVERLERDVAELRAALAALQAPAREVPP